MIFNMFYSMIQMNTDISGNIRNEIIKNIGHFIQSEPAHLVILNWLHIGQYTVAPQTFKSLNSGED